MMMVTMLECCTYLSDGPWSPEGFLGSECYVCDKRILTGRFHLVQCSAVQCVSVCVCVCVCVCVRVRVLVRVRVRVRALFSSRNGWFFIVRVRVLRGGAPLCPWRVRVRVRVRASFS